MSLESRLLTADDLHVGLEDEFAREITAADVLQFAAVSGDANPLHIDETYAQTSNFKRPIVHGAFQVGLASAMIGMRLPGRNVLLGGVQARFPAPLYYPARVRVKGQIVSWNRETLSGTVKVVVVEEATQAPTAEVHMGFTFHEGRDAAPVSRPVRSPSTGKTLPAVLITGASGGLGAAIADALRGELMIVPHVRSGRWQGPAEDAVLYADLQQSGWQQELARILDGAPLYGVVHTAWPGQPHGSLLDTDDATLERQIGFGAGSTIALARVLAQHAGDGGGRMVVLSSIVATHKPVLPLAAYSLGKAVLEHSVKLLAPELARKKITINAISPSFIPAGMNDRSTERQQLREQALVPMGRLCRPHDVIALVRYLLSPEASFVSGQVIGLNGGQL